MSCVTVQSLPFSALHAGLGLLKTKAVCTVYCRLYRVLCIDYSENTGNNPPLALGTPATAHLPLPPLIPARMWHGPPILVSNPCTLCCCWSGRRAARCRWVRRRRAARGSGGGGGGGGGCGGGCGGVPRQPAPPKRGATGLSASGGFTSASELLASGTATGGASGGGKRRALGASEKTRGVRVFF